MWKIVKTFFTSVLQKWHSDSGGSRWNFIFAILLLSGTAAYTESSLDSERLDLEMRMQARVEDALGKILPRGQFVVVIRVEPLARQTDGSSTNAETSRDLFYLPGVPVRTSFDNNGEEVKALVESLKPESKTFQRFIRRVQVTLVIDSSVPEDTIAKVRDLTRQMISLDPERGDTLDIQQTAFAKPVDEVNPTGIQRVQTELKSYWLLISLVLIVFCIGIFFLFMFGPLRGFLNTFVRVLPTLKNEDDNQRSPMMQQMPMMPAYMQQPYGLPGPAAGGAAFSGSLQVENPNKLILPFGFIREDNLTNLAILLSRETPEKAAVVLGYLPPEWISRVLSKMDASVQSEIASHLATTRQLLPEQVEDIEQDLKRRLDYLIGGPDRIYAVYESLDPEAQRRMLDSLKESRPELAQELRQRTMMFEDIGKLDAVALKALLREIDLQTLVVSLKGAGDDLKNRLLEHMPQGKAEIIRQELEMSDGTAGKATGEAQRKVINIAKRLEREGQINIPLIEEGSPSVRYGGSLRSGLKFPAGAKADNTMPDIKQAEITEGIEEKIRKFMNRGGGTDKERFSKGGAQDTTEVGE